MFVVPLLFVYFNAGLLARGQYPQGPAISQLDQGFLHRRVNSEILLNSKSHYRHSFRPPLMLTSKFSSRSQCQYNGALTRYIPHSTSFFSRLPSNLCLLVPRIFQNRKYCIGFPP